MFVTLLIYICNKLSTTIYLQDALQAQIVIKKMSEMMDTTDKAEMLEDRADADHISDQEKITEVSIGNEIALTTAVSNT